MVAEKRSIFSRIKPYLLWTRRSLSLVTLYMAYLMLGGFLFSYLEQDMTATNLIIKMIQVLRKANYTDVEIKMAFSNKHNKITKPVSDSWNEFSERFLFSMVLITTMGYGNVAPKRKFGKAICVVYTLFGLPLNITYMRLLSLKFRSGLRKIFKFAIKFKTPNFFLATGGFSYFMFFIILLVLFPAAFHHLIEPWSYITAIYYCFVTLATIGFGDYVAGINTSNVYLTSLYNLHSLLMFIWFVVGIAYVTMCLNLLSYLFGLVVLDKLDSKCHQRRDAKKTLTPIYNCVAELNFQLAKYTPERFTQWKKLEDFMNLCDENPQKVTLHDLRLMFDIADELLEKTMEEMEPLYIPERFKSIDIAEGVDSRRIISMANLSLSSEGNAEKVAGETASIHAMAVSTEKDVSANAREVLKSSPAAFTIGGTRSFTVRPDRRLSDSHLSCPKGIEFDRLRIHRGLQMIHDGSEATLGARAMDEKAIRSAPASIHATPPPERSYSLDDLDAQDSGTVEDQSESESSESEMSPVGSDPALADKPDPKPIQSRAPTITKGIFSLFSRKAKKDSGPKKD